MKKFARIENDVVVEILEAKILPPFHPSLEWVEVKKDIEEGYILIDGEFKTQEEIELIEDVLKSRMIEVSQKRNSLMSDGFAYQGNIFQIGLEAQKDMLAVQTQFILDVKNPHGGSWRSVDNVAVDMDDDAVKAFFQAAFAYIFVIKETSWTHKENLANIVDKSLLKEYNITIGWK